MGQDVRTGQGKTDVRSMAETMKAQAREIERLHMELCPTSLKQKEDIPELTSGFLEEIVQEERVTRWMRMCVGALKEFLDKVGGPLQLPTDHAGANGHGDAPPPRDHVLAYQVWEVLCKSHTTYMTKYTARAGQDPKERSPYGSLEEARGALGSDFHWKNVHFTEIGGALSWQTCAGQWIPLESEPTDNCRSCVQKGAAMLAKHWHFRCPHWS